MAAYRYFADIAGEAHELTAIWHDGHISTAARHFSGLTTAGQRVQATRKIEMKSFPSKHVCDARCMHAQGKTMRCECSCGGKNHGRGRFVAEAA